jgi:hypothetical protein
MKRRVLSSGILHHVALVRTSVSEECSASIIRVTRISKLGTMLAVTKMRQSLVTANIVPRSLILVTLVMEAIHSSETSVLTRATWRNIPDNGILHSHHHENLKSYMNEENCTKKEKVFKRKPGKFTDLFYGLLS